MNSGSTIILHLIALPSGPDDPPAAIRLRVILKRLLRSYGFRCVHAALDGHDASPELVQVLEEVQEPASSPVGPPDLADGQDVAELQTIIKSAEG